jgi:hypothetical protein
MRTNVLAAVFSGVEYTDTIDGGDVKATREVRVVLTCDESGNLWEDSDVSKFCDSLLVNVYEAGTGSRPDAFRMEFRPKDITEFYASSVFLKRSIEVDAGVKTRTTQFKIESPKSNNNINISASDEVRAKVWNVLLNIGLKNEQEKS